MCRQARERFIECQEIVLGFGDGDGIVQVDALPVAAMFGPALLPGTVDEDATHGLGGGGKEVSPAVPVRRSRCRSPLHQPEVGLVDQSRGLERLSWFLLSQFLGGKLPQLVVDQRQELLGGVRIALLDLIQDPRYFGHAGNRTARRGAHRLRITRNSASLRRTRPSVSQEVMARCVQFLIGR